MTSWYRGIDLTMFLYHLNPLQRCNQGRFNVIKPPQTAVQVPYTLTRCVGHLHTSLEWFDLVLALYFPTYTSTGGNKVCRALTHQFRVVRSPGTLPNHTFTGGTWCMCTYTPVWGGSVTSNLPKSISTGGTSMYTPVWGGSITSNHP